MGFTPIDRTSDLKLEWRPRDGYDAMLHVYGRTSRTIAFRRTDTGCEWIGEQEIFDGHTNSILRMGNTEKASRSP
jgi:hypothetical protein